MIHNIEQRGSTPDDSTGGGTLCGMAECWADSGAQTSSAYQYRPTVGHPPHEASVQAAFTGQKTCVCERIRIGQRPKQMDFDDLCPDFPRSEGIYQMV